METELTQYNYGSTLLLKEWPEPICGVTLKPFCLGHVLLLEESKNPFISKDKQEISEAEMCHRLFQALIICALTYEEGLELLSDANKWIAEWERFQTNLLFNMRSEPEWNHYTKRKAFENYIQFYLHSMPSYEVLHADDGKSKSGTDWRAALDVIFRKLNHSETEVLNMPLTQLFQKWTVNAEGEGAIKVFNKFTADKIKAAERKRKEAVA
jgi:hypothetical protein